jgi:AbrB family looped-hinge helix DNA binding protein
MRATIAERGQVTIPKELRNQLGLRPGTVLDFEAEKGKLVAKKADLSDPVQAVMGCIGIGIHTDDVMKDLRGNN